METDNTKADQEMLKGEFDHFLSKYNEDSTLRSSRPAFDAVMAKVREVAVKEDGETICPGCGKKHPPGPLVENIFVQYDLNSVLIVAMEMRFGVILKVAKTKEQALEEMGSLPPNLPEELRAFTAAFMVVRPTKTTLEDLAAEGVRPYHIIKWLRQRIDEEAFTEEVQKATQDVATA